MANILHWEDLVDKVICGVSAPRPWILALEFGDGSRAVFESRTSPSMIVFFYPSEYEQDFLETRPLTLDEASQVMIGKRITSLVVPMLAEGLRDFAPVKIEIGEGGALGLVTVYLASEDAHEPVLLIDYPIAGQ